MRAQLKTPGTGPLSHDKTSLSHFPNYRRQARTATGFSGGNTYTFFTNSTLQKATVSFSDPTWACP